MFRKVLGIILLMLIAASTSAPQAHASSHRYLSIWELSTFIFFTDGAFNPLPLDLTSNPMVTTVLSGGVVKATNPGQVLVWVEVQHIGFNATFQSLSIDEILPPDWEVSPIWPIARGAIHVYFVNTTSFDSPSSSSFSSTVIPQAFEITQPSTITASTSGVHLLIPDFSATTVGHPLMPYQSILLSVKLNYALKGTSQPVSNYPTVYNPTASSKGWIGFPFYPGSASFSPAGCLGPGTDYLDPSACFFTAYANVVR